MRSVWNLTMLLVCATWACAQQYEIKQLTVADGLPHSIVTAMVEDSLGYLWIGTEGGGLSRFDGKEFVTYNVQDGLLSNFVEDLYIDKNQALWIIQGAGVSKYHLNNFTNFSGESEGHASTFGERCTYIVVGDTLVYISRSLSMWKIFNDLIIQQSPAATTPEEARQIQRKIRNLLFNELQSTLSLNATELLRLEAIRTANPEYEISRLTNSYVIYTQDSLHLIGERLISLSNPRREQVLYVDIANDQIWSTDHQPSMIVRNLKTAETKRLDFLSFSASQIITMVKDNEGNLWMGTQGRGVMKYFSPYMIKYDAPFHGRDIVMAIEEDRNGRIWAGTDNGIKIYGEDKRLIRHLTFGDSFRNEVRVIRADSQGYLWVGTYGGLAKLDENFRVLNWWDTNNGLPFDKVNALDFDTAGNLYLATRGGGLIYFDHRQFTQYDITNGLLSNVVWSIRYNRNDDYLFVGTSNGLNIFQNGVIRTFNANGIKPGAVLSVDYNQGRAYLGTLSNGLYVINLNNFQVQNIDITSGISSNLVYFVFEDPSGRVWAGTEKGIELIQMKRDKLTPENITHFNAHSGLTGTETNINAYKIDSNGSLWFGVVDGLYKLNRIVDVGIKPLRPHFVSIENPVTRTTLQKWAPPTGVIFDNSSNPVLPHTENHIRFEFNNVNKTMPFESKYTYRLVGFDPIWSEPGMDRVATYYNLRSGSYTFYVAIAGTNQIILSYPFTIKPPFYQYPMFIISSIGVVLLALTYFVYKRTGYKIKSALLAEKIRQEEQNNIRKELGRDFHDEMGTYLSRIITYVSLMKMNGTSGESHRDTLQKIEESAKYLHKGTRDFIWASDPSNDFSLRVYYQLVEFAQELFSSENQCFRSYYLCKHNYQLLPGTTRQIMLIFKEAMHNAFKHSHGRNFSLRIQNDTDHLEIHFEDDGAGFDENSLPKTSGIYNIRLRSKKLNAHVYINPTKHQGTKISLHIPVNNLKAYELHHKKKNPHY